MRSINFNYTPQHCDDLLIDQMSTTVDITLYSHFCKPIKCTVEVEKMVSKKKDLLLSCLVKLFKCERFTNNMIQVFFRSLYF